MFHKLGVSTILVTVLFATSPDLLGQVPGPAAGAPTSSGRAAAIKNALARERGDITAMEASSIAGGGVFVGYSSGMVVNCRGDGTCREYSGLPTGPVSGEVRDISISRNGDQQIVWVAHPHGVLFRCENYRCVEIVAALEQQE